MFWRGCKFRERAQTQNLNLVVTFGAASFWHEVLTSRREPARICPPEYWLRHRHQLSHDKFRRCPAARFTCLLCVVDSTVCKCVKSGIKTSRDVIDCLPLFCQDISSQSSGVFMLFTISNRALLSTLKHRPSQLPCLGLKDIWAGIIGKMGTGLVPSSQPALRSYVSWTDISVESLESNSCIYFVCVAFQRC